MSLSNSLNNQRGVALVFVLVAVVLLGLMAGIANTSWQTIVQRSKEQELLWRGGQIRRAIDSYYTTAHGGKAIYPMNFEQILRDPRFVGVKRHLRRQYLDPITGEDWVIVKGPGGRMVGVRSSSDKEPFKNENFSIENEKFVGKTKYSEWEFVHNPKKKTAQKKETPATPSGTGGGNPFTPSGTGGGNPFTPSGTGGGNPFTPSGTGGGNPFTPSGTGGGNPFTPSGTGGGNPFIPSGTSDGNPSTPKGNDEGNPFTEGLQ